MAQKGGGPLSIPDLASELRDVAVMLATVASEGESGEIAGPVKSLMEICTRYGNAWSNSWIGYHSRIYYRDFQTPPPGAHFDSEWGNMQVSGNQTRGDWREFQYDEVVNAIEVAGGQPDLRPAEEYAKSARRSLDDCRPTVVSVLTAALAMSEDDLVREGLAEAKESIPLSQDDAVRISTPSGQFASRDRVAMSQGIIAPPHIGYLGHLVAIDDPGRRCRSLGALAERMANHLDRSTRAAPARVSGGRIFIGHGNSQLWRALKDFISDRMNLPFEEFNRVSPAGIATVARLESMLDGASVAFLVLTAEDEHSDGSEHARENVIHEAGLFQGRLGFPKAIVLLEEGCAEFSNIHGLGQIRFRPGKIEEAFEEVRRVLEREGIISTA